MASTCGNQRSLDPDIDVKGTHVSDSWPPSPQPDEPGAAPSGEGSAPPHGPGVPQYGQPPPAPQSQPGYGQPPPAPQMQPGYGQPPYGDSSQPPQTAYPQQELLPQEVKPSGSRVPLVVGLVVALALVGGGIAAWLLLRNNDESTRAQYCAAIKRLLPNGDLTSSLGGGQQDVVAKLSKVADLAPSTVAGDWKTLTDLVHSSQQSGTPDVTLVLGAIGAARNIVADSNDHCGTTFTVPSVP